MPSPEMVLKVRTDMDANALKVLASDPSTQAVAPGVVSTEYERTVAGGWWGAVLMAVGALVAASETIVNFAAGMDSHAGQVVGMLMAIIGAIYKAVLEMGYIASRSQIKVSAATGAAQVAVAQIKGTTETGAAAP